MQSIPTKFKDHTGNAVELEQGQHYYARHPGLPAFDVSFGADLTNADFASHRQQVTSGKLDIRVEEIDATYILFLQNGMSKRLEVDITLQLRGMVATTPTSLTQIVAPETEVFVSILRPQDGVRQAQYGYQLRYRELD